MNYAVEGNVNVGKTTFIKNISRTNNLHVIPETQFPLNMKPFATQLYYITKEIERKEKNRNNLIIMDRSIISVYLYTILSNTFSLDEKVKLLNMINKSIEQDRIIIPNELFFIIYPYNLINQKHLLLKEEKNTQKELVDYRYYLEYNLFFANILRKHNIKIVKTEMDRQVILLKNNDVYYNLSIDLPEKNKVILLDGAPATGKSTIGKIQKKYNYIEEVKYKKYSLMDYTNQVKSIIERIKLLEKNNAILDTSFLMGITHLFYSHKEKVPQEQKIKMIDEIMQQVPLYLYCTKIVYLYTNIEILLDRKEKDKTRKREHFFDNIKYIDDEMNFYTKLNTKLGKMSNIHLIEASRSTDEVTKMIEKLEDKELLLIDLFYCIKECIKEGEI